MTAKKRPGRWKKGESGNPAGRKAGSRNAVSVACDELLEGEAAALTRKAIDKALEGDMNALRLCMDRLTPPRKDRPIFIELPKVEKPADILLALDIATNAVATGQITPSEGQIIAAMLETKRRAFETEDQERRIAALEGKGGRDTEN